MAFWRHADVMYKRTAYLGALDLQVAQVGVDDLHVAGIDVENSRLLHHNIFKAAFVQTAFFEAGSLQVEVAGVDLFFFLVDDYTVHDGSILY